jgi:hypothetical protein
VSFGHQSFIFWALKISSDNAMAVVINNAVGF